MFIHVTFIVVFAGRFVLEIYIAPAIAGKSLLLKLYPASANIAVVQIFFVRNGLIANEYCRSLIFNIPCI